MGQAREAAEHAAPVRMVTLTLVADRDYLALARTSAMHVGALLLFPLPRVNDLRLAVDEACTSFLQAAQEAGGAGGAGRDADGPEAAPEQTMELSYDRHPTSLHVTVRARAPEGWPGRDELGWAMLGSLVGQIRVQVEDGIGTLTLIQPLPTGADR
jgi:serine/threonine-protein kinase RsbW